MTYITAGKVMIPQLSLFFNVKSEWIGSALYPDAWNVSVTEIVALRDTCTEFKYLVLD